MCEGGQLMSGFLFVFSDDAKPHKTKPNAAYYTRIPLFRGSLLKMLAGGCPWMNRIRRVAIAADVPYSALKFGETVAPLFWMNALTTDPEDSLHIIST